MKKAIKVRHGRDFWQEELKKQGQSGLCVSDFCRDRVLARTVTWWNLETLGYFLPTVIPRYLSLKK